MKGLEFALSKLELNVGNSCFAASGTPAFNILMACTRASPDGGARIEKATDFYTPGPPDDGECEWWVYEFDGVKLMLVYDDFPDRPSTEYFVFPATFAATLVKWCREANG